MISAPPTRIVPASARSMPAIRFSSVACFNRYVLLVSLDLGSAGMTLEPGATYHFRVVASNAAGGSEGPGTDLHRTRPGLPHVERRGLSRRTLESSTGRVQKRGSQETPNMREKGPLPPPPSTSSDQGSWPARPRPSPL